MPKSKNKRKNGKRKACNEYTRSMSLCINNDPYPRLSDEVVKIPEYDDFRRGFEELSEKLRECAESSRTVTFAPDIGLGDQLLIGGIGLHKAAAMASRMYGDVNEDTLVAAAKYHVDLETGITDLLTEALNEGLPTPQERHKP